MHARLELNVRRSLALGVCESVQAMAVPSSRRHRGKSRADRLFSVAGWAVFVAFCGLAMVGAR